MKWVVAEVIGPLARRVGGQVAAGLVALGMAEVHEAAAAAIAAWAIIAVAELIASSRGRQKVIDRAKTAWGRS